MIPALLKIQYAHLPFYAHIRTMFTIHNLQYQGIFGIKDVQDVLGLGDGLWTSDKLECFGCANFMKAGPGLCRCHHHRKPQLRRGNHHCLLRRAP